MEISPPPVKVGEVSARKSLGLLETRVCSVSRVETSLLPPHPAHQVPDPLASLYFLLYFSCATRPALAGDRAAVM